MSAAAQAAVGDDRSAPSRPGEGASPDPRRDPPTAGFVCAGFTTFKRRIARRFFPDVPLAFSARGSAVAEAARRGAPVLVWGNDDAALAAAGAREGVAVWRVEDGFVRSRGLGTRQVPPASIAVDDLGLYYDATRPSRLETIAATEAFSPELVARAGRLRERLVATKVSKYNLGPADAAALSRAAAGRPILLVVGQVPDDASLRYGLPSVSGNLALLAAVRRERPEAFVVYKEHPDLVARSRPGWLPDFVLGRFADRVVRTGDATHLFGVADAVHTITSLAGFEALIHGARVVCHGAPFYAGWGLTEDRVALPRRTRRLTLDELLAAALIRYPLYRHPESGAACAVEDVVEHLAEQGSVGRGRGLIDRGLRATVVAEAWLRHALFYAGRPR